MKSVIHEIRNHLAIAIANVEAFRDGVLEASPARLGAVLQALREVDVLLGSIPLGKAAPSDAAAIQMTDVCHLIANEVLAFEAAAKEKGIAFNVERCADEHAQCSSFACDPTHVAEIVNNVVSNAIRYTPRGGRIDIECRRADGLTLMVTDSGPGVRDHEREQIFESGFRGTASEATTGSGLGLSVVQRFVAELGGSVAVENVPGSGARFTVNIPTVERTREPDADGVISLL
jgi:two-component system sensor histidine kinase BaeS